MKPIILITGGTHITANGTPQWSLNMNYAEMVRRAGGIPVLAVDSESAQAYAEMADGLLLSGGADVATNLYHQEQKYDFLMLDLKRDEIEWKILDAFAPTKKPIFGICRGFQMMNVYFGGTLIQDIPDQLGGDHSGPQNSGACHDLKIQGDSILGRMFGESLYINSYHHQGLEHLAPNFTATAWSDAGGHELVEAMEHTELPYWAVQWHPERMTGEATKPADCVDSMPIFEYFVNQCKK